MRTLLLLRHAKSSWDNPKLIDFDRPLNPRGRRDAPRMGVAMRRDGHVPDRVLCSTARRTRDTWALVEPQLSTDARVTYLDRIYDATPDTLLDVVRNACPDTRTLLLVGHNPGIEMLAMRLIGPGSAAEPVSQVQEKFPTTALAVLRFETDRWDGVAERSGALTTFVRPKDLRIAQSAFQKRSA